MARFDRYILSQLMIVFGFFSLVLVLVYWINRAVVLFDTLIANGQSAGVFLEFTALSLPSVMQLALPLAAFAAAIYVTNRMTTESEMIVVQATGYSAYRLARPVLYFGLIVTLLMSILVHILVPASRAELREREADIAQNITARLLTPGQFLEPVNGVTFYIRDISPGGELNDIFLSDTRDPDQQVIYTATQAYLVSANNDTQLVMIDGLAQTLSADTGRLATTSFKDLTYNIGALIKARTSSGRRDSEVGTWDLINPTQALIDETGRSKARLLSRGHDRINQSILGTIAALIGFASLLVGGFSRFGVWRQIIGAIILIIIVKGVESVGLSAARGNENLWFLVYLPSLTGLFIIWALLFTATRPYLFKRTPTAGSA